VPTTGAQAPGGGGTGGTADLTREANIYRVLGYVSGIGSEWMQNYTPPNPVALQRRIMAIAGNISDVSAGINTFDFEKIREYLSSSNPQVNDVYQGLDVNLDTKVDVRDLQIVNTNANAAKQAVLKK
jgi:hypothetical protein